MVKSHTLLTALFTGLVCISLIGGAAAQRQYHFGQEWAKIWIREDGSIDLLYNISITLDSGDPINWISIGQPRGDFFIDSAEDQYGNTLKTQDISSGSNYQVKVNLDSPLQAGETIWFTLLTNVARMIYSDETNAGNDGMQFTMSWFSVASIEDVRVLIVLPPCVDIIQKPVHYLPAGCRPARRSA